MARIAAALILMALAGCAAKPVVRVDVQEVRVPVPVRDLPPPELLACSSEPRPLPHFEPAPGGALLPTTEIPAFQGLVNLLSSCLDAWAAWGTTESEP